MGCGKTLTTIGVIGSLYNSGKIKKALIVSPLSVMGVWLDELRKFASFDYTAARLEGTAVKKADTLRHMKGVPLQIVICNYESTWRMEAEFLRYDADIIVADESHRIKTHNTRQSKAMHKLGAKARYKIILTGTLVTNKAIDVFSQYKFADPSVFGNSFYAFRNKYFYLTGYGNYTPVLKKTMEQELTERIHSIAFRVTKAECLDLPETMDIIRSIELEASAMKTYNDLAKDSFAELSKGEVTAANILSKLLRLSQVTGGFIGDDEGNITKISAAKLDALEDIIDEAMNEDKKIVVIARFVAEIKAIQKLLESKNLRYSVIMGEVRDRETQITEFQNNPDVKIFIGQIATAGLGITLTAASTMVFYSLDYSMANFEQAKARIHRAGQTEKCTYIYLTAKNTVDEKILSVLRDKADLAKTLVDDYRSNKNPFA